MDKEKSDSNLVKNVKKGRKPVYSSLLTAVVTSLALSTSAACVNAIEADCATESEICDALQKVKIKFPRIFKMLNELSDPSFTPMVEKNLVSYMNGEKMDVNPVGQPFQPVASATILSAPEVRAMQSRKVAYLLYLNFYDELPWSINDLDDGSLRKLLTVDENYYIPMGGSNYLNSYIAPSYPEEIFSFLKEKKLIGKNHHETVVNFVEWFRNNAIHHNADDTESSRLMEMYGHLGAPTVMDMISRYDQGKWIKVQGCAGSIFFFQQVLETIGIPVKDIFVKLNGSIHNSAKFPSIQKTFFHGDDLHAFKGKTMNGVMVPVPLIFVDINEIADSEVKGGEPISTQRMDEMKDYIMEKAFRDLSVAEKYP
ncbi:MAG TPA: hypothetical protein P5229_04385, partial [Candidatus Gracilibacteria bacterium]|nr:hypothetical protein [Candidatus Gracilibacteria bacterium]